MIRNKGIRKRIKVFKIRSKGLRIRILDKDLG
jgi:hypothetical protein